MTTWLFKHWDAVRDSLWFVPALGLLGALLLSFVMLEVDAALAIGDRPGFAFATTTGAAARSVLSALAGALVTVAGVVFSLMMLTLAQTSTQFGSRLLRSFLQHNVTQATLSVFLATSLYCFSILRTIRDVDGNQRAFVPHLSVGVGMLLGLLCVAVFVYFIHYIAQSIQAPTVVMTVATDLENALERLFPEKIGEAAEEEHEETESANASIDDGDARVVECTSEGYVQAIDGETLMQTAVDHETVIRLLRRPGHFVSRGTPIAKIARTGDFDAVSAAVNVCFLTGSRRTPRQDLECAVGELVEVAVRALSPGINDPGTTISGIDYLGASLCRLAERKMPFPLGRDSEGTVRVITPSMTFGEVLDAAYDEIRQYGRGSASVLIRLVETLESIARKVTRERDRDAILRQAVMIERAADESLPEEYDRSDVKERLRAVRRTLDALPSPASPSAESGTGDD